MSCHEDMFRWPELTASNCFFIVLHSQPLGRINRRLTCTESRPRKVHRKIVLLVSAMVDSTSLPWDSDPSIKPNTVYCVGWVDHITEATSESYSNYDWHMDPLVVLSDPVDLKGVAIGRNGGGHVAPREEHAPALRHLNAALHALNCLQNGRGLLQEMGECHSTME
jgi:hypothetical protein